MPSDRPRKDSIYQWIQRELRADPEIPYAFQDMMSDGFEDVTGILFRNTLPFFMQEQMAFQLEKGIRSSLDKGSLSAALRKHLSDASLYYYLDQAVSRIRQGTLNGSLDPDALYSFGIQLATEESRPEAVKLGMLILGQYENDMTRSILRTLGLHSSYTLYAVAATALWKKGHPFLFDLARNTVGYGKLYCLRQLRPVTSREKTWLLRESIDLAADRELAAVYCLVKPDMSPFLLRKRIDSELLEDYSVLISYGIGSSLLPPSTLIRPLISRYLSAAEQHLSRFIDLAALAALHGFCSERMVLLRSAGPAEQDHYAWLEEVHRRVSKLLSSSKDLAEQLLYDELSDPYEDTGIILRTIRVLHSEASIELPPFSCYQPVAELYGFTVDLLSFFLYDYPQEYLPDLIDIWYDIIPEEVWDDPVTVPESAPDSDYQGDLYTAELLHAMRETGIYNESLILDCLHARHQKVRFAAAECAEHLSVSSDAALSAVKEAVSSEQNASVQRLLRHLSGVTDLAFPVLPFQPSPAAVTEADPLMFQTRLIRVEGLDSPEGVPLPVSEDETLCIVQHPIRRTVLIARQNGVILGGLGEEDEAFLAMLQDSGRTFYAKIKDPDAPEDQRTVMIFESGASAPVLEPDNVVPFRRRHS